MSKKILFFGNERLATGVHTGVSTLQALLAGGYEVAAIVVAQNQPGKSRRERPLEVAAIAKQHNIPLLAPSDLAGAREQLAAFGAGAAVLVAYGKIVPQAVLDIFPQGIINIHPSLLPLHRGSTPIEGVILEGAGQTGVSLIRLSAKMDAGPIYAQATVPLDGTETKQSLARRLSAVGTDLLLEHLPKILDGSLQPAPQDETAATYDRHITRADSRLDWTKPAIRLEREIRAYLEWPKSHAKLGPTDVIITQAHTVPAHKPGTKPGDIEVSPDGVIMIGCASSYLCIDTLKPAGKPEMSAAAFLAGYKLEPSSKAG
jgi:methionyl-tRNA formyltransferase